MRNGTHSNLTLVDNTQEVEDDAAAYFPYRPEAENARASGVLGSGNAVFALVTVSITCAAVSVAAGGYAIWLTRQQATRQALTDVNDILRSCQSRMSQLEADVQRLPSRKA